MVRVVENSLSFNQLNISLADIPCVLGNDVGEALRSSQPVTLYITVNVTPPDLCNSPPCIPTEGDEYLTEEVTITRRIQLPVPEHLSPLSHHQPVETGNIMPQNQNDMSSTSTKNPHHALHRADEAMKRIDRSNTWERAVGRIKWVMDTLGPIAEVRLIPL